MSEVHIDKRKEKILEAVVLDYIATAEPVGSRTISKKYDLGISSATIRNEMADLEELGFIEQPHTSAGRIPSEKGYRYYVDYLMSKSTIRLEAKEFIQKTIVDKTQMVEDVVKETLKILSDSTNYTSMVLLSNDQEQEHRLQLLQLLLVEPGKALMVIVTDGDQIENRFIDIPMTMGKEDLDLVSMMINQNLKGLSIDGWQRSIIENIFANLSHQKEVVDCALDMLSSILKKNKDDKVFLNGGLNMLTQPEFSDVYKVKNLLQSLEQEEILSKILDNDIKDGISVKIGRENTLDEVKDCSVIVATYRLNGDTIGKVGLIGPIRMDYSHAVSVLDSMLQSLQDAFEGD